MCFINYSLHIEAPSQHRACLSAACYWMAAARHSSGSLGRNGEIMGMFDSSNQDLLDLETYIMVNIWLIYGQ